LAKTRVGFSVSRSLRFSRHQANKSPLKSTQVRTGLPYLPEPAAAFDERPRAQPLPGQRHQFAQPGQAGRLTQALPLQQTEPGLNASRIHAQRLAQQRQAAARILGSLGPADQEKASSTGSLGGRSARREYPLNVVVNRLQPIAVPGQDLLERAAAVVGAATVKPHQRAGRIQ